MFRQADVATIGLYEVFEQIYADTIPKEINGHPGHHYDSPVYLSDGWDEQCRKMKAWCNARNAHYYARCKESFFEWEAREEAFKAGKTLVVLDNLS